MNTSPQSANDGPTQWWVAGDNEPRGPYSEAFVRAGLRSGSISSDTLLCPIGGQEWRPAFEWPRFETEFGRPNWPIPPAQPPSDQLSIADSPLTNPQLPQVANWICIYCILISPLLIAADQLSCCVTGFNPNFAEGSAYFGIDMLLKAIAALGSLAITIILYIGGCRLRSLRRSAIRLIKTSVWISVCAAGLFIIVSIGVVMAAAWDGVEQVESTTAATILNFVIGIVRFAAIAFEIFTLVWLHRHGNALPLIDN